MYQYGSAAGLQSDGSSSQAPMPSMPPMPLLEEGHFNQPLPPLSAASTTLNSDNAGGVKSAAGSTLFPASEAWAQTALSYLDSVILVVLPNAAIVYASPGTATVVGHNPNTLKGRQLQEYVHFDDALHLLDAIRAAFFEGKTPFHGTFRFRRSSGEYVMLSVRGTAVRPKVASRSPSDAAAAGRPVAIALSGHPYPHTLQSSQFDEVYGMEAQNHMLRDKLRKVYAARHASVPTASALNERANVRSWVTELLPDDVTTVSAGKMGLVSPSDYVEAHMQTAGPEMTAAAIATAVAPDSPTSPLPETLSPDGTLRTHLHGLWDDHLAGMAQSNACGLRYAKRRKGMDAQNAPQPLNRRSMALPLTPSLSSGSASSEPAPLPPSVTVWPQPMEDNSNYHIALDMMRSQLAELQSDMSPLLPPTAAYTSPGSSCVPSSVSSSPLIPSQVEMSDWAPYPLCPPATPTVFNTADYLPLSYYAEPIVMTTDDIDEQSRQRLSRSSTLSAYTFIAPYHTSVSPLVPASADSGANLPPNDPANR
ncbi:white collar 2 type of transcription factor [Sorochytrium milnesiophthora]